METTYRSEYGVLDPARVNEYSRTKPRVILSLQSERMDCGGNWNAGRKRYISVQEALDES